MERYYNSEINVQILISLLKTHGIRKVIVSPGTTNVSFVGSIQFDDYFEIYSAIDERAAAYMACGLAEESDEPVVLSCTGATASRNYIPGLTEAYYKKIPILAVTSTQHIGRVGQYVAQVIDRSSEYNDVAKMSITIPNIVCEEDKQSAICSINNALLELTHKEKGPVHINLSTVYSDDFSVKKLPEIRIIKRISDGMEFPRIPRGNVGIFIGNHRPFNSDEIEAIEAFCESSNAVVFCDHTSNYSGKYKIMASLIMGQKYDFVAKDFDLMIHIGYVSGSYMGYSKKVWRVNRDGIVRDLYNRLEYVFEMEEKEFFSHYCTEGGNTPFYDQCRKDYDSLLAQMPELPFSNAWIARNTIMRLNAGATLHLGILNTLRSWNYFECDSSIQCYCNTGGFGIDGCLSSLIGAAWANPKKQFYGVIGDLSFFYDVNSAIHYFPANVHLMIINNGIGAEFKLYSHRCYNFGRYADDFMAGGGHNGFKSKTLVKSLASNLGICYLSAESKDEFSRHIEKWLMFDGKAQILEVFTDDINESEAIKMINNLRTDFKHKVYNYFKGTVVETLARKILRR